MEKVLSFILITFLRLQQQLVPVGVQNQAHTSRDRRNPCTVDEYTSRAISDVIYDNIFGLSIGNLELLSETFSLVLITGRSIHHIIL